MALRRAYLLMHRSADAQFASSSVTTDQFVVLSALAEGGELTQRALADRIACDQNTLRAMLLLLEKKGLVQRAAHPGDGRARLVSLTPAGAALEAALWEQSTLFRENLVELLGTTDAQLLIGLLQRLAQALPPKETTTP